MLLTASSAVCRTGKVNDRMKNEGALGMRFLRHAESIAPMCPHILCPWAASRFPVGPVPGDRTSRKEHALPIVRDEFRPAIPRRDARQQRPLPLYRQPHPKAAPGSGTMKIQRAVNSLLTVCLTDRDNSTAHGSELCSALSGKALPERLRAMRILPCG